MIVVTGAAGFIGSCLVSKLNKEGHKDIVVVDDFSYESKKNNLALKSFVQKVHRDDFFQWFWKNHSDVRFVFHLGARTDTTEFDPFIFETMNLNYSKEMWNACCEYFIPLIYASSAATYGAGENGYSDDHKKVKLLKPLNPYGESKNDFDKWVLKQKQQPPYWAGMKFFNVFGPNEYHKGRMASVVFHAFNQISETGKLKLFRSHRPDYENGGQLRDFIYVKDIVDMLWLGMKNMMNAGIVNAGTGKARTFLDLGKAVFKAMDRPCDIEFIDTPKDIRDKYQYFTQADMSKFYSVHPDFTFHSLEDVVEDYVQQYLKPNQYY